MVLREAGIKPRREVGGGIPPQEGSSFWSALKQGFQIGKRDPAPPASESRLMDQIPAELAAEFEGVISSQIGNLVNKTVDLVWPDNYWKIVEGANFHEPCKFYYRFSL